MEQIVPDRVDGRDDRLSCSQILMKFCRVNLLCKLLHLKRDEADIEHPYILREVLIILFIQPKIFGISLNIEENCFDVKGPIKTIDQSGLALARHGYG